MRILVGIGLSLCLLTATGAALAQENGKPNAKTRNKPSRKKPVGKNTLTTPERQAHVMTFVKQHHPELSEILIHLKEEDKRAYSRAIRDLYRVSTRLINIREKDPEGHELELNIWKLKSRAMLLATRYKMSKDKKLRKQLEDVLDKQVNLQLAKLRRDRNRQAERLKKLEKQIKQIDASRKQTVNRQFRYLTQGKPASSRKAKTRPAQSSRTSKVSTGDDKKTSKSRKNRKPVKKNSTGQ